MRPSCRHDYHHSVKAERRVVGSLRGCGQGEGYLRGCGQGEGHH